MDQGGVTSRSGDHHRERAYKCQRCLNHKRVVCRKGHQCPYKECACDGCDLNNLRSKLMTVLRERGLNHSEVFMTKKAGRKQHCMLCSFHGQRVELRGHKRKCKWAECQCSLCVIGRRYRDTMAKQTKHRRMQRKPPGAAAANGSASVAAGAGRNASSSSSSGGDDEQFQIPEVDEEEEEEEELKSDQTLFGHHQQQQHHQLALPINPAAAPATPSMMDVAEYQPGTMDALLLNSSTLFASLLASAGGGGGCRLPLQRTTTTTSGVLQAQSGGGHAPAVAPSMVAAGWPTMINQHHSCCCWWPQQAAAYHHQHQQHQQQQNAFLMHLFLSSSYHTGGTSYIRRACDAINQ